MKYLVLFVTIFILTAKKSYAQFDFRNDTAFIEVFGTLKNQIDTTYTLTKDFDFEFRFWINYGKLTGTALFVLTNRNNKWSARLFKRKTHPEINLSEIKVSNENLNTLWAKLNANHILSIKNSYELKDRNGNYADIKIYDGTSFYFELITKTKRRNYFYHCPKDCREEYKYIREYKWVLNIINLIYKHCKLDPNSIC